jgi:hypothetical protein
MECFAGNAPEKGSGGRYPAKGTAPLRGAAAVFRIPAFRIPFPFSDAIP